jgi:precorrin-3B synthase
VHWIGCARACGSPSGPHVRVQATGDGYLVGDELVETGNPGALADLVAAARRA